MAVIGYNKSILKLMNRKNFVKLASFSAAVAATSGLSGCTNRIASKTLPPPINEARTNKPVFVQRGKNRFKEELLIWGVIPLQIKVSSKDTNGALFAFEHNKMGKGGPPRHLHFDQDEWFYAWKGNFLLRLEMKNLHFSPAIPFLHLVWFRTYGLVSELIPAPCFWHFSLQDRLRNVESNTTLKLLQGGIGCYILIKHN